MQYISDRNMVIKTKFSLGESVTTEYGIGSVTQISIDVRNEETDIQYFVKVSDGHNGYWHNWHLEEELV